MLEHGITMSRYRILERIGAGGMGVVYAAEDLERGMRVALKTLRKYDIEQVYQLKREFRALADLDHPNLVALYDLVVDAEACFFTMELLDGEDLLAHVAASTSAAVHAADLAHQATGTAGSEAPPVADDPTQGSDILPSPCDVERLRAALPQLVRGLCALHAAGKIHRDVKPSNIRVTSDGRAVLLDFGLVAELERGRVGEPGMVAGTISYMAPEQCAGDLALTDAVDWYALGVVMYQCLTGKLPFTGPALRVMHEKQTMSAARPSHRARGIPPDLDELCCELLERDPASRLGGRALLARLTGSDPYRAPVGATSHTVFAGRDRELRQLAEALARVDDRRASVVVVRAPSGMGKTALVSRFFESVHETHERALLLRGRCLEREEVPYKAIDGLIDALSEWWRAQAPREAEAILPRDAWVLPTLFPVLGRVAAIANAPRTRAVLDPQARRTHAFAALREMLQRLADRRPVVLFLDDMQWVDRDTTALLADVMRAPDPPRVLLVLATRADDTGALLSLVDRMDAARTIIDVGPLPEAVAVPLAMMQLREHGPPSAELARHLVHEAQGSPFFLMELARYIQGRSLAESAGKTLDAMLVERVTGLGDSARAIAEVIAVAGEPLARRILASATGVAPAKLAKLVATLCGQRVLRANGSRNDDTIEPYHDRIREAVLDALSDPQRALHHRALAIAMAGSGAPAQLARHWYGAGDVEQAAPHARRAGDEARGKLDFDLSARWYAMALESGAWTDDERRSLHTLLADALADAGRLREAADEFTAAAIGAEAAERLELHRRAAGALLQSGYVTEGMELTRVVLAGVGLSMPKTPMRALLSMLWRRAWLRLRGLGFRARPLAEIGQAELTRVDVCEGVSFGLALVDTFRSMDFASRFLASALRLGEPWRVSRALALETDFLAATAKSKRAVQLLQQLERLTPGLDAPQADSQLMTTRGLVDFFVHNHFRRSLDTLTEAIARYRSVVGRMGFELDAVTLFCCWSLYYLGEVGELARRVPAMAEAAARNGNRHTVVTLRCAFPVAWLARKHPDQVEAELDEALRSWATPEGAFQLQHLFALCSRIDLALYRGEPDAVTPVLDAAWTPMRRALIDRPPVHQLLLYSTCGRHALARATIAPAGSDRRRAAIADARRFAKKLRKRGVPLVAAAGLMIEGGIAELEDRRADAIDAYRRSAAAMDSREAVLFAHAIRARLGPLVGGDEGAGLRRSAIDWFERQDVRDPEAMLAMLLPGPRA